MEVLERMPFTAQRKIFKVLAELADMRCLTQEEQDKYDESRKVVDDYYSGLYGSYITGRDEGEAKANIETAKRLLAMGLTPEQVAEGTQLSMEEVKKLIP